MFWPQCEKPSCLGRNPKHDSFVHPNPRGQTYVRISRACRPQLGPRAENRERGREGPRWNVAIECQLCHDRRAARRMSFNRVLSTVSTAVSCPNQCNREIMTVLHISVRAPVCEKRRSIAGSGGRRRLDGAGFHRRKIRQNGGLRSSTVGSHQGRNGALSPRKSAIFRHFFDDFLRVFLRARPSGRKLARIRGLFKTRYHETK